MAACTVGTPGPGIGRPTDVKSPVRTAGTVGSTAALAGLGRSRIDGGPAAESCARGSSETVGGSATVRWTGSVGGSATAGGPATIRWTGGVGGSATAGGPTTVGWFVTVGELASVGGSATARGSATVRWIGTVGRFRLVGWSRADSPLPRARRSTAVARAAGASLARSAIARWPVRGAVGLGSAEEPGRSDWFRFEAGLAAVGGSKGRLVGAFPVGAFGLAGWPTAGSVPGCEGWSPRVTWAISKRWTGVDSSAARTEASAVTGLRAIEDIVVASWPRVGGSTAVARAAGPSLGRSAVSRWPVRIEVGVGSAQELGLSGGFGIDAGWPAAGCNKGRLVVASAVGAFPVGTSAVGAFALVAFAVGAFGRAGWSTAGSVPGCERWSSRVTWATSKRWTGAASSAARTEASAVNGSRAIEDIVVASWPRVGWSTGAAAGAVGPCAEATGPALGKLGAATLGKLGVATVGACAPRSSSPEVVAGPGVARSRVAGSPGSSTPGSSV
ncbi:MAG: hypothetical protein ACRDX8_01550 [Acidimicrobiales bacterium]